MNIEINFDDLLYKRTAIVFDSIEEAAAFLHEAKIKCPETVRLWDEGEFLQTRYNIVHPSRFAVSFYSGFMQYMGESHYVEHGYDLIEFSTLIDTEPIFESDVLFSELFKVV